MIHKLFKKAQSGNDRAFLKLFQPYEADIYRIAYVYLKNEADALDIVQETACKAFDKIHTVKEPEYLKTWFIKIAINSALNLLKQKEKAVLMNELLTESVLEEFSDPTDNILMKQLIDILSVEEKNIILLKYYQDLTFTEIAQILHMPLGTAKSICYRALKKLRIQIEGEAYYESN